MTVSRRLSALAAAALAVAGAMFILYPALRPWHDESTIEGATASMGSGAWLASHMFAVIGFILIPMGLLGLYRSVSHTRAGPMALTATVTTWLGAGLVLPYYGAETFSLYELAGRTGEVPLLDLAEAIRYNPVAMITFAAGLLAMAVGGVLTSVAVWRSEVLPRASGVPFALGLALFLPQFFTPAAVRIGHGVLLGAGAVWLAVVLWRRR